RLSTQRISPRNSGRHRQSLQPLEDHLSSSSKISSFPDAATAPATQIQCSCATEQTGRSCTSINPQSELSTFRINCWMLPVWPLSQSVLLRIQIYRWPYDRRRLDRSISPS